MKTVFFWHTEIIPQPGTIQGVKILKTKTSNLEEIIATAKQVLATGGLVVYPTETVYGVGVDATNPQAVEKLFKYKSRREGKPLSIAVTDQEMATEYVELNQQARKLYQKILPGPYTIVSRGKNKLAPGVESEFGTLGVRIPDSEIITRLVDTFNKPITATSANSSGKKRPYTIQDIFDNLSEKQKGLLDLVIDAGELPKNEPSIVIDTTLSTPLIMRGEAISKDIGTEKVEAFISHSETETKELAGKLMLKHWNDITKTGLVVALDGKLGTGKTIFTKGIAQFLKIEEVLTSPTYTYHLEYPYTRFQTTGFLHHLDVWKIDQQASFNLLEVEKLIKPNNVVVIEWWEQVAKYWSDQTTPILQVSFEENEKDNLRKIKILEK